MNSGPISSTAIFAASDIPATLSYYEEVLGFESNWKWGDPPTFGGANWNGVSLMFGLNPELASKVKGHQHWIKVDEVDELYARHVSAGATIISPITDQPWGVREYILEDINGYHLRFAGAPSNSAEPSKPLPPNLVLQRRKPTPEEHIRIVGEAFDNRDVKTELLEHTWSGVIATIDGESVGVARIMRDADGWYSIWDVAVLPQWQGQHIGEAMMKEALATVHDVSPGAWVYLFTFKHGFYEKLGFNKETVSMRLV